MRLVFYATLITIFAVPASAERIVRETPKDVDRTAPVGDTVWESTSFDAAHGVTIADPVRANWGSLELVDLPAGSNLIIIREKKTKACRQQTVTTLSGMQFGGWKDCLIDTDNDGRFDRVSFNEVAGAKDVVPPVSYVKGAIPIEGGQAKSFRQTLIFLGKSGTDIKFSYREFSNDMARPAFTEDLSLPAPSEFPQTYKIKNIALTVSGIGPDGLSYRIK